MIQSPITITGQNVPQRKEFNLTKFKVLLAVELCNQEGIPATSYSIARLTGIPKKNIVQYMPRYEDYVNLKRIRKSPDRCLFQYSLSAKGRDACNRYFERFEKGFDLKLRSVPKRVDWTGVKLLPDMDNVTKELKDFYNQVV